jgi:Tfp pilus assembly protein PilF
LNKDLKNALAWIDVYINNTENAYWAYRVKAQIQSKLGDNVSAIKTAELAIKIATEQGNDDYVRYTKKEMAGYKSAKK